RLGELYEDVLGKNDEADDAYARSIAAEAAAHAAFGRFRTAARSRDLAALGQSIGGLANWLAAPSAEAALSAPAKAALLDERAQVARAAGDGEGAGGLVMEALAADPGVRTAWLLSARLNAQAGEPAALGEALA